VHHLPVLGKQSRLVWTYWASLSYCFNDILLCTCVQTAHPCKHWSKWRLTRVSEGVLFLIRSFVLVPEYLTFCVMDLWYQCVLTWCHLIGTFGYCPGAKWPNMLTFLISALEEEGVAGGKLTPSSIVPWYRGSFVQSRLAGTIFFTRFGRKMIL
jgi:hypothetical protein